MLTSYSACSNPAVGGRPALTRKRDEASGLTLLEVPGLNARAVSVASDGGAEVLVVSFAPSLQAGGPGKVPAPMLQVAAGRLQQGGGKTRVAAGLQQAGAGAAIFSRGGVLLGLAMLPVNTAPRLVAGIVPESTYPLAMATEMVASGGATGGPSNRTAGEVLASIRAGLVPVTCAATP